MYGLGSGPKVALILNKYVGSEVSTFSVFKKKPKNNFALLSTSLLKFLIVYTALNYCMYFTQGTDIAPEPKLSPACPVPPGIAFEDSMVYLFISV